MFEVIPNDFCECIQDRLSLTIIHFNFLIMRILFVLAVIATISLSGCEKTPLLEAQEWDKVVLTFSGPETSETAEVNPFMDYRLNVTFTHGDKSMVIPGYYAADGTASETSAETGNVWKVVFRPGEVGEWSYEVSFRTGKNIAVGEDVTAGESTSFDGQKGSILVKNSLASLPDLRAKGRLVTTDGRYLKFTSSNEYFLKGGADSPENWLGYADFDGTYKMSQAEKRDGEAENKPQLHTYAPHLSDWKEGDPSWKGGKGKSIIGAVNYLASKGINSIYFLAMNIGGDGKDVWPYINPEERYRFDCSKLDQWEIVFDHMEKSGIMLHVVTQETENELLLDDGGTGLQRKLYYRELIARFGHHLAVTWNMGEENGPADFTPAGQTTEQQTAMVRYMKHHDPYQNFVVIHTHSAPFYRNEIFEPLLGFSHLDGPSMQLGDLKTTHSETLHWTKVSADAGKPWVVCIDEIGPASRGVDPDDRQDNNQDTVRTEVLWANLMAGGSGAEWYFGYNNHDNDLNCEDWRSRDRMWDYTRITLEFWQKHVPFWEMTPADSLVSENAWCLAKTGESYLVYLPYGGTATIDLQNASGEFVTNWFNPRAGGDMIKGPVIQGGSIVEIGQPPVDIEKDWALLLERQ